MRGHATEFWIEDVTGACGWCCHTCGIDKRTRNMADAEAAIDVHELAPTPAPAGEAASASSRPAGAPIPTTSEPTCGTCHRLLSCVGTCPKGCPQ